MTNLNTLLHTAKSESLLCVNICLDPIIVWPCFARGCQSFEHGPSKPWFSNYSMVVNGAIPHFWTQIYVYHIYFHEICSYLIFMLYIVVQSSYHNTISPTAGIWSAYKGWPPSGHKKWPTAGSPVDTIVMGDPQSLEGLFHGNPKS